MELADYGTGLLRYAGTESPRLMWKIVEKPILGINYTYYKKELCFESLLFLLDCCILSMIALKFYRNWKF